MTSTETINKITEIVFFYYNTPLEKRLVKTTNRADIRVKQVAHYFCTMWLFGKYAKMIGFLVGRVDRNTVLNSVKVVSNLKDTDPIFREEINHLREFISDTLKKHIVGAGSKQNNKKGRDFAKVLTSKRRASKRGIFSPVVINFNV